MTALVARPRAAAGRRASGARHADERARLRRRKREAQRISPRSWPPPRARSTRGYHGHTDGLLMRPVTGSVTSPFG